MQVLAACVPNDPDHSLSGKRRTRFLKIVAPSRVQRVRHVIENLYALQKSRNCSGSGSPCIPVSLVSRERLLIAAVGPAAASKENGDAFYKPIQNKNNQRGAEAQDERQQKQRSFKAEVCRWGGCSVCY